MTDNEIWNYALKYDLVVLTKDTDFYNKALVAEKAPKIIHFQLPNVSLSELHKYFELNWEKLKSEISEADFVIAKSKSFEIIDISDRD